MAFVQFSRGTALEGQFFGSMGTAIWTLPLGRAVAPRSGLGDRSTEDEEVGSRMGGGFLAIHVLPERPCKYIDVITVVSTIAWRTATPRRLGQMRVHMNLRTWGNLCHLLSIHS